MPQNTKDFQENLSTIYDELHLAKQWGKASLILTIHKSTFSKEKTKLALQKKLGDLGYRIVYLEVNKIDDNFIDEILKNDDIEDIVFCISNIDWGSGKDQRDSYRILNLYRETFIEQKIKAIFLLTIIEASKLPGFAPDFWAFRHRVLEFGSPHARDQKPPPVGLMLWHIGTSIPPYNDLASKISMITKMIAEIPDQVEAISLRTDLLYELSYLYWCSGEHDGCEKSLITGIKLAKDYQLSDALVKFQNGYVILYYEQENYQRAFELINFLIENYPKDCILYINQAILLFAMKKRYNSVLKGNKAVSLCPQNSWLRNSLGFLHYFAGNLDEAVTCFQKAIDLSPNIDLFYESLSVCYLALGIHDKANITFQEAQKSLVNRSSFQEILKMCIDNGIDNAVHLVNSAIEAGKLNEFDVDRDPVLNGLLGSKTIQMNEE